MADGLTYRVLIDGEKFLLTAFLNGQKAGWMEGDFSDDIPLITLNHTYTDDQFRGQGVASGMYAYLIKLCANNGYKLKPVCSFVQGMLNKNPEDKKYLL